MFRRAYAFSTFGLAIVISAGAFGAGDFIGRLDPDAPAVWQHDIGKGYRSTQIIVRCAKSMPDPATATTHAFGEQCARWGVHKIRKLADQPQGNQMAGGDSVWDRTYVIEVPPLTDTRAMAAAFAALGDEIEYAEVDGIGGVAGFIPNDASFNLQYYMHNTGQSGGTADADIDAPEAWAIHTGESNIVTIGVIDSGVTPHPDFADRMVPGTNTNNPATPDLTTDGCPHGTHVAGLLAAAGNNSAAIAGMNWNAQIMPVRVVNGCTGTESQAAAGILWAVNHGADVLNMSLQYYTGTSTLNDAIQTAHQQGVVLVAAAGNFQGGIVAYPARFANCMAVSATNKFDTFATSFSNWGPQVDISAPGDDIWSTWTNNNLNIMDGTSMATPLVSGLASLIKSYRPELTNTEIMQVMVETVDDLGPAGWDDHFGAGRLNAGAAMAAIAQPIQIIDSIPINGYIDARHPSELDGSNPVGLNEVILRFDRSIGDLPPTDLSVTLEGSAGAAPTIDQINPLADDTVEVLFSSPIPPGAWTVITHQPSGTSVRVGYLPGDVNGDRMSSPVDILALIDSLNGVGPVLLISSTDMNRSGLAEPSDILRLVDLLNGADAFDVWNGATLP